MKKLLLSIVLALCAASVSYAQNTIAVSAANIQGINGARLTSGSLCFQGTDQNNNNITFQVGGGGAVVTTPFCTAITAGVISTFNIPNPANTSPVNIRYHIQIKQGTRLLSDLPGVYMCVEAGACTSPYQFNFDTCLSSGACANNPIPMTSGPAGAPGAAGPTGATGAPGTLSSNSGITVGGSACIKGASPWVDVTCPPFNARFVPGVFVPNSTATMSATSANVTLAAASNFVNGDGIDIIGGGASVTISTPAQPTVTPSAAAGGTATNTVVNSATASSTYEYWIMAQDAGGGLTPAGTPRTITNGQASLGAQPCPITSMSRTGNTATINWASTCGAPVGSVIHVTGSTNADFTNFWSVTTNTGTVATISNTNLSTKGIGSNAGDSNSSTGGSATFFYTNHLNWAIDSGAFKYIIYAKRPGDSAGAPIGQTKPSGLGNVFDVDFDDFGATMMAGQNFPAYIPATPPSSALPDMCVRTISSGAGSTSLVLSSACVNAVSGATAVFDDAPGILAAYNYALAGAPSGPGILFFPPAPVNGTDYGYFINSHLVIPFPISVHNVGPITLNETWEMDEGANFNGIDGLATTPQFGLSGGATINIGTASPAMYFSGSAVDMNYESFYATNTNGGTALVLDNTFDTFDHTNFVMNMGNADFLSMAMVIRSDDAAGDFVHFVDHSLFFGGGTGRTTTWTPIVFLPPTQNGSGVAIGTDQFLSIKNSNFALRGIEADEVSGGPRLDLENINRQGGVAPLVVIDGIGPYGAAGGIRLSNVLQDTEAVGTVALFSISSSPASTAIDAWEVFNGSSDIAGIPPPFTGNYSTHSSLTASVTGKPPSLEGWSVINSQAVISPYDISGTNPYGPHDLFGFNEAVHFPSGYSLFWDMPPPAGLTASAHSGGSLPPGALTFAVSAAGPDQGETALTPVPTGAVTVPGTCPGSGNCSVQLNWTPEVGAIYGYNVYACATGCVNSNGTIAGTISNYHMVNSGFHVGTNSLLVSTSGSGQVPPVTTGTGLPLINPSGGYFQQVTAAPVAVASLPSASVNIGQIRSVNDSTAISAEGQTCVGSSTGTALAFSNGTVWKCF